MNENNKGDADFSRSELDASVSPMPLKVNPNANSLAVDSKFTVDVSNSDVHVLVGSQAAGAVNMTGEYSQWEDAIKPDTLQASQLRSMAKLEKVDEEKEE